MLNICDYKICTGCGLCVVVCPKKCISLNEGRLGHLYPIIDETICVNCGLCLKACPAMHSLDMFKIRKAFAAWAKDEEEYKTSTSGAAASVLSKFIIQQGGVVYGCAVFPGVEIHHIRVENLDDLGKLKGSKYVQSSIVSVLPMIKKDVVDGRTTLFIGTPCQVAAVKNLFKSQPENLLLVDLICHGVPSLSMLKKHVYLKVGNTNVTNVKFRNGNSYMLQLLLQDGSIVYQCLLWEDRFKDTYYNAFIDGFSYRESCHTCKYACSQRISDITIGDFWGLKDGLPLAHPYGCSVLLPSTEKGINTIESLQFEFNLFERTVEEAVQGNDQLRNPKKKDFRIAIFNHLYHFLGIGFSYRLCVLDRMLKYYIFRQKVR